MSRPKPTTPIPNSDIRLAVRLLNDVVTYQEGVIESHTAPDGSVAPRDEYTVRDAKLQAGHARGAAERLRAAIAKPPLVRANKVPPAAELEPVVDILDALKKSLKALNRGKR